MLPASLWLPCDTHIYANFSTYRAVLCWGVAVGRFFRHNTDFSTISVYNGEETQLARLYAWLPRLPRASAHVTPLGGGRRLAVTVTS
jgi:hypothetical protein